jgi:hypothetical protein
VVDTFALAFNVSPFGIKHQNEEASGLTSLSHKKMANEKSKATKIQGNLE